MGGRGMKLSVKQVFTSSSRGKKNTFPNWEEGNMDLYRTPWLVSTSSLHDLDRNVPIKAHVYRAKIKTTYLAALSSQRDTWMFFFRAFEIHEIQYGTYRLPIKGLHEKAGGGGHTA